LLILCVVALDDKGNQQALSSATQHEWTLKRVAYSASLYNSCSVDRKGQLRCAGYNVFGNLGNNSTTTSYVTTATLIDEVNTYQTVATGVYHSCAIQRDGLMRCWGWNHYGAVGDGSQYNIIYQPTLVSGSEKFSQVAVSYYTTCGLTSAGQLFCWGGNLASFGDGTNNQSLVPKKVQSDKRYIKISGRTNGFCGITDLNELFCWGYNNTNQLGFPTGTPSPSGVPIRIDGNEKYKEIAVGTYHSCGITITNELKCWGTNTYSQIGTGAATPTIHPNPTLVGTNYIKVSPGNLHTCGIKDTGEARCWGANLYYQSSSSLGTGNVTTHAVVDSGTTYSDIYTENDMSCGITRRGEIRCWGRQSYGMFGIGSSINESLSTHKDPFSFTADYLTNSPTEALHSDSFDLNLSINALNKIRGIEPTHFSYKMTSNCSDTTPYSEKYTLNTPIHFDLSSVQDGLIQICLLTFNEFGNGSQVPKIITFTKATKASLTISNQVTSSDNYSFGTADSYGTTNFLYLKNIGAVNASQVSSYLNLGSSGSFQFDNSGSPEHPICTTDLPINETCAIGIRFEPSYNWPYPNTDTALLTLNYYSDTEPKSLEINLSGVLRIPGCTNSSYQNYNQYANYDDGSCYSWDSSTMDTTTMDTTTMDTTTMDTTTMDTTTMDTTTSHWWETTTNPEETTTNPEETTTMPEETTTMPEETTTYPYDSTTY
jgi:alpha-tubulin suppressor-like RCC1 family protein